MTTKSSIVSAQHVKALESPAFHVHERTSTVGIAAAATETRPEPSRVVHVSFGEWPAPRVEHPDSMSIQEFTAELMAEGYGDGIQAGRRDLATWIDNKTTLRSLRLAAGLSQEQLASLMDTSQPQIARIESGKQDLSLSTMKRLAKALDIDIHKIVDAAGG